VLACRLYVALLESWLGTEEVAKEGTRRPSDPTRKPVIVFPLIVLDPFSVDMGLPPDGAPIDKEDSEAPNALLAACIPASTSLGVRVMEALADDLDTAELIFASPAPQKT
jgi:hypothetical protein